MMPLLVGDWIRCRVPGLGNPGKAEGGGWWLRIHQKCLQCGDGQRVSGPGSGSDFQKAEIKDLRHTFQAESMDQLSNPPPAKYACIVV